MMVSGMLMLQGVQLGIDFIMDKTLLTSMLGYQSMLFAVIGISLSPI